MPIGDWLMKLQIVLVLAAAATWAWLIVLVWQP